MEDIDQGRRMRKTLSGQQVVEQCSYPDKRQVLVLVEDGSLGWPGDTLCAGGKERCGCNGGPGEVFSCCHHPFH